MKFIATVILIFSALSASAQLVNGSFESGFTGWTSSGSARVRTTANGYPATDGVSSLVFSSGQLANDGVVSQTFATIAGKTYELSFDVGAFSLVATSEQRLNFRLSGTAVHFDELTTVRAPGNSTATSWLHRSYLFTADSAATTVRFADASATTQNVDLQVDNVTLHEPEAQTDYTENVTLQWDAPDSADADEYSIYEVFAAAEPVKVGSVLGTFLQFTVARVPVGTHSWVVTGSNEGGEGAPSDPATITIVKPIPGATKPTKPRNLRVISSTP